MIEFQPKFITFDMYGTLTHFQMSALTRELVGDVVPATSMDDFLDDFEAQRLDEILGPWKPYPDVICDSLRRTLQRWDLPYREADGHAIVAAVPSWGPHPTSRMLYGRWRRTAALLELDAAADGRRGDRHVGVSLGLDVSDTRIDVAARRARLSSFTCP